MKISKLFIFFVFLTLITSTVHAGGFYKFKYKAKKGDSLGKILEKFVKKGGTALSRNNPMIKAILKSNSHVSSWRRVAKGTTITLYIEKKRAKAKSIKRYVAKYKSSKKKRRRKPRKRAKKRVDDFEEDFKDDFEDFPPEDKMVDKRKDRRRRRTRTNSRADSGSSNLKNFFQVYWRVEYSSVKDKHFYEANTPLISMIGLGFAYEAYFSSGSSPFFANINGEFVKYQSVDPTEGIEGSYALSNALNGRLMLGKAKMFGSCGLVAYLGMQTIPMIMVNVAATSLDMSITWFGAGALWDIKTSSLRFRVLPSIAMGSVTTKLAEGSGSVEGWSQSAVRYGISIEVGNDSIFLSSDLNMTTITDDVGSYETGITEIVGRIGKRF